MKMVDSYNQYKIQQSIQNIEQNINRIKSSIESYIQNQYISQISQEVQQYIQRLQQFIEKCHGQKTALHIAVEKENAEIVKLLLRNDKIDVNMNATSQPDIDSTCNTIINSVTNISNIKNNIEHIIQNSSYG